MSLKNKGDFLMHGVVLQNRMFSAGRPDVSRETFLRKRTILPSAGGDVSRETAREKPLTPSPPRSAARA
jgi:hypothetical protein